MNRRSRGSWLPDAKQGHIGDEFTEACAKELQRHYDSTVIHSGVFEDEDVLNACSVGVSGIIVYKPVFKMGSGDKIKEPVSFKVTSLLHEFCKGKIFLVKLFLPHHPGASQALGPKYDQISPSSYFKTAEFLVNALKNVNMEDGNGLTPLVYLLQHLAEKDTCATPWLTVIDLLLRSGSKLEGTTGQQSSADIMLKLAKLNIQKKNCEDDCLRLLVIRLYSKVDQSNAKDMQLLQSCREKNHLLAKIIDELMTGQ